jgi:hypothetical protein
MKGKILFQEEQSFRFSWSWWLIVGISIFSFFTLGIGLYEQFVLGRPWGDQPMSDTTLLLFCISMSTILGGLIWLFSSARLKIALDHEALTYSYFPFERSTKTLTKNDLKEIEVRKYRPLMEYGGWGYRRSWRNGKALNIKGKWGLQLVRQDGKKILIGTQKPKELASAVVKLKEFWESR